MAHIVTLPDLGENVKSGELTALLVKPGDLVRADSPALELETDKAVVEVPAGRAGRVVELLARVGERLEVGAAIFSIEEESAAPQAESLVAKPAAPRPAEAQPPEEPASPASPVVEQALAAPPSTQSLAQLPAEGLPVPASPTVRRLARELGVEIRQVPGRGPAGRISREDVKAFVKARLLQLEQKAAQPGQGPGLPVEDLPDFSRWGEIEELPLGNVRRATARHLASAWLLTPRVTQFDKADITELELLRLRLQAREERTGGPRLTMTAILILVLAQALRRFPQFNASLDLGRERLIRKHYCHVGVAVDTERGLLVPVLRNADQKGVRELASELSELSRRARERKSAPEELQGACITLTNLGGIGGTAFTPIVNHPEAAILGVSRGVREPVWDEGSASFKPRLMLPLSLSYDHRIIDGADGARFVRWICEALENPLELVM